MESVETKHWPAELCSEIGLEIGKSSLPILWKEKGNTSFLISSVLVWKEIRESCSVRHIRIQKKETTGSVILSRSPRPRIDRKGLYNKEIVDLSELQQAWETKNTKRHWIQSYIVFDKRGY